MRGLIPAHAGKTRRGAFGFQIVGAHPRSRGENVDDVHIHDVQQGSSPLTRGKPPRPPRPANLCGLIPAHAGKTLRRSRRRIRRRAHPRSRGENSAWTGPQARGWGSSPLTRGKLNIMDAAEDVKGLIPAHAGKTVCLGVDLATDRAHPRSRGENLEVAGHEFNFGGSSPLTRGKPLVGAQGLARVGLIPAHAGKTTGRSAGPCARGAHPRSRGENHTGRWAGRGLQGSSPLTRGKLLPALISETAGGLIPAHAGKTGSVELICFVWSAHPRSRGENGWWASDDNTRRGSSPLTRGKRLVGLRRQHAPRLIPAHAGKTSAWSAPAGGRGAHPRSRGENAAGIASVALTQGSSPLTRGKPIDVAGLQTGIRLIPAHAGKTSGSRVGV